jgi:hypothetical protein
VRGSAAASCEVEARCIRVRKPRSGRRRQIRADAGVVELDPLAGAAAFDIRGVVLDKIHPAARSGTIDCAQTASTKRNHTLGMLRLESRMNWYGGSQKPRASNDIQEPVRATRTLPRPSRDIAQLV